MSRSIVVICMHGAGHVQLLLPVIGRLVARGCTVHMLTHTDFRERVERAGARFVDLYSGRPLEAVDSKSFPIPSRFVTFAGVHGQVLAKEVKGLEPGLIIHDTFSVVAPLIARELGIPQVNVCPNHAPIPERAVAQLRDDPRVSTSAECLRAIERLSAVHGMDANPFSYMECLSPWLNLYPEPEEFLDAEERAAFEPVAFFGSLPDEPPSAGAEVFPRGGAPLRVHVSFGTIVWLYFPTETRSVLQQICDSLSGLDMEVAISLGGRALGKPARPEPEGPNVRVLNWIDQWSALAEADVFITHHGINSTHEAIFHRVPMLSYPFFGDQPAQAARCQALGLALPLVEKLREPLHGESLLSSLERLVDDRDAFRTRLEEARSWEMRTIAGRETVIDRVLGLMGTR